ncbi:hypothetical protein L1987_05031 [Smallanthus sonchifolius]|uniref:Uncharacterized protein n=1 Tax=Smallanthus sonchifolius TaxID=185202 RepID=A0ACB9JUF2_9ASTR|nr:hypothetical protein L1987_05031 [Smallanthus sonchifolius]
MHRQSLGSPASKLQCHGVLFSGAGVINDETDNNFISEDHRNDKSSSCSAGDEERKSQKSDQQKSNPVSLSSRLVHLIPILMFFCFLILYLSSHDPSNKDSIEIDDNIGGGSMAIRSMRNLQQQLRYRLHRKFRHYG